MSFPQLQLVTPGTLPDPPYQPDTHVRGWRFELDHERIYASDTWALAGNEMRPWLLMLWMVSWTQRPAGSMPNDDAIIAAKIGMPTRVFAANRDLLLRGWRLCADGRLYHSIIVEQVQQYLDMKEKERARKSEYRNKKKQDVSEIVPRDRQGQTLDSHGIPVGVRTPEPEPEPEPVLRSESSIPLSCFSNEKHSSADAKSASDGPASDTDVKDEKDNEIKKPTPCPHQKIIALYHKHLGRYCPEVRSWGGARPGKLTALWRQNQDLEWWDGFFEYCAESKFLTGRATPKQGAPPFVADLEWLITTRNFQRIHEGLYHRG